MFLKIYVLLLCVILCYAALEINIVPEKIVTFGGSSYTLHFQTNGDLKIIKCYAKNANGTTYSIDYEKLGQKAEITEKIQNGYESLVDEITSLGGQICGFKISNATPTPTTTRWTLTVETKETGVFTKDASLIVYNQADIQPQKSVVEVERGDTFSINCASGLELSYCELYSPSGQLAMSSQKSCFHTVDLATVTDFGVWRCHLGYKYLMEPQIVEFNVKIIEKNIVRSWQKESEEQIEIGCSVTYNTAINLFCSMVRPDEYRLKLDVGLASDRYTSIGTNLDNTYCVLQIQKPLKEYDYGTWSCEIKQKYMINSEYLEAPIGSLITINKTLLQTVPDPIVPKIISTKVHSRINIQCRVYFSSPYCYFRSPNSTLYPIEDARATSLGFCYFTVEDVQLSDNGTWICGFARTTGQMDDTYTFQVSVMEARELRSDAQEVTVKLGSKAKLLCSTRGLGDQPLQYCRFLSPLGQMYHIVKEPEDKVSGRMQYSGRGLDFGDCGIELSAVTAADAGIWSCITRVGINFRHPEIYDNILLAIDQSEPEKLATGSAIGISIGVVISLSGTAFLVYRRYRKNRPADHTDNTATARFARDENLLPNYDSAFTVTLQRSQVN